MDDGPDGVPPGTKYGYLELSNQGVVQGDPAYSFWVNPANIGSSDVSLLYSQGAALDSPSFNSGLGESGNYSVFGIAGASGSLILGAAGHGDRVIAVTDQIPSGGGDRTAMHVRDLLAPPSLSDSRQYDFDRNGVLDAVEYDLLFTRAPGHQQARN
ncbi:MAG: hypothetical protein ACJ746_03750 [Bryobacteraceae bacterium]